MSATDSPETAAVHYEEHICAIYNTDSEREALLLPFIRNGLCRGDKVIYISDPADHQAVLNCLDNLLPTNREDQLRLLTPETTYLAGGVFSPKSMVDLILSALQEALNEGFSGLSISGDLSCLADQNISAGKIRTYELMLDQALKGRNCAVLCLYDRRVLSAHIIIGAIQAHPVVLVGEQPQENLFYIPDSAGSETNRQEVLLDRWLESLRKQREAGEAVEAGLRQIEAIVDNMNDGLIVCDSAGRIVNMNPAAKALLGYESHVLGLRLEDFRKDTLLRHPDGQIVQPNEWPLDRALAGETFNNSELELQIAGGKKRVISYSGTPITGKDGRVTAGIITLRDITDQKRIERDHAFLARAGAILGMSLDFHETMQNLVELVVPFLADYCAVDIVSGDSLRPEAMAAVDEATTEAGQRLQVMYRKRPQEVRGFMAALSQGRPLVSPQVDNNVIRDMAPRESDVEIIKSMGLSSLMLMPLMSAGKLLGVMRFAITGSNRTYDQADVDLARELASRAAVAAENAMLYREAQEAIRSRDDFISVASHELKTPITSLRGFAEMAIRQYEKEGVMQPERMHRALQVIDQQAIKLTHLVLQLLDISRLDRGKLVLEKRETDVSSLVSEAVEATKRLSERHNVISRIKPGVTAIIDPLRIEQVLTNILDNAIRYSPAGGEIEVEVSTPDSESLRISVRDHGIGITPQHRERVFERFYQAHQASRHYGGMGLGLYISSEIISMHGGTLEASYPEDGGTEFVITIPLMAG